MSNGNGTDFKSVMCGGWSEWEVEHYDGESPDLLITRRHNDNPYIYDYRRAIIHYYKSCGCKILDTNNNWWNDCFYVDMSRPTKAIDPEVWFNEVYKDGIYWSKNLKALVCMVVFVTILAVMTYLKSGGYI